METKNILTSQKEVVKNWKGGFVARPSDEGIKYIYEGGSSEGMLTSAETYCAFIGLDYQTVKRLGEVSYSIEYNCVNDLYILCCETYIDNFMNERLSVEYEDNEDWLGFYGETIDVAQRLPINWRDLISDEQREEVAREWCEENSDELKDFLSDSDRADIAYDYIDDNANDVIDKAYDKLGDYERREFIKDCIDNL